MEDLLRGIERQELAGGTDNIVDSAVSVDEDVLNVVSHDQTAQIVDAPRASRLNSLEHDGLTGAAGGARGGDQNVESRLEADELVDEGALVNQILDDEDEDIMVEGDVSVSIFARDHVGVEEVWPSSCCLLFDGLL